MKNHSYEELLKKLEFFLLYGVLFFFPLFFFPFFADTITIPKQLLLGVVALGVLLIVTVRSFINKKLELRITPFSLLFLFFVVLEVGSLFLKENNLLYAIIQPMGLFTILPLLIVHCALLKRVEKDGVMPYLTVLAASGAAMSIIGVLWYLGANKLVPIDVLQDPGFTPTGSLLTTLGFLLVTTCISLGVVVRQVQTKETWKKMGIWVLFLAIQLIGVGVVSYEVTSKFPPIMMPFSVGWSVALKAIEANPFFGVGVSNYEHAYTAARPFVVNQTPIWNVRFPSGPNFFLHYLTVLGLLGGITTTLFLGLLFLIVFQSAYPIALGILALVGIALFIPPTPILLFLLGIVGSFSSFLARDISVHLPKQRTVCALIFLLPILLTVFFVALALPLSIGEENARQAVFHANHGDMQASYNDIHTAVTVAPYRSDYRILSSQITFMIGSALLQQKESTDDQKKQAAAILDQGINEAKLAIQLAPQNSVAWSNLASMYENLVSTSAEAQNWALSIFTEALARDPSNPIIRSTVAGLLDYQGNTDAAVQALEAALQIKPDLPAARYALAIGYAKQKKLGPALQQLTILLTLLPPDSVDAKQVKEDISSLKQSIDQIKSAMDKQGTASAQVSPSLEGTPVASKITPTPTPPAGGSPAPTTANKP